MIVLSICLPTYKYDAQRLADRLAEQCRKVLDASEYEIIIGDDATPDERWIAQQRAAAEPAGYVFLTNRHNLGRAANRNHLAKAARGKYILFIDADSQPVTAEYISDYLSAANAHAPEGGFVLAGGTRYFNNPPPRKSRLRWKYGRAREERTVESRMAHPYRSLSLNNVLAPSTVWHVVPLDESVRKYGHEDTLWGAALQAAYIPVYHIDNNVYHVGIESDQTFISKSIEAAESLAILIRSGKISMADTTLAASYSRIKNSGLGWASRVPGAVAGMLAMVWPGAIPLRMLDAIKLSTFAKALGTAGRAAHR